MFDRRFIVLAFVLGALLMLPPQLVAHVCTESNASCCCCDDCSGCDAAISCATTDCCFKLPIQGEKTSAASRVAPPILSAQPVIDVLVSTTKPDSAHQQAQNRHPPDSTTRRLAALCVFLN